MKSLQALLTGYILGSLAKSIDDGLLIEVNGKVDSDGNYLPQLEVVGRESGERLLVKVEVIEETTEDTNAKRHAGKT